MKLDPFVSVDDLPFSASEAEVLRRFGEPLCRERNAAELNALDYGSVVYRFQDGGRLEEVTAEVHVIELDGVAVPRHALEPFLRAQDPALFTRADFVVSPRYGLAFDPRDPPWVTALAAHCIDTWRAL